MTRRAARAHLAAADPVLGALIEEIGPCGLRPDRTRQPYEALVSAIAHQQLHANAARAILGRLEAAAGCPIPPPEAMLSLSDHDLRACGFSASKIAALRDLAARAADGTVPNRRQAMRLADATLIERLSQVRGVGRWTVEMLLIFTLGRPDVLPVDDFGVREGYRLLHGLAAQPKPRELAVIGEAYAPFRSTAAWYLWRAADRGKTIKQAAP